MAMTLEQVRDFLRCEYDMRKNSPLAKNAALTNDFLRAADAIDAHLSAQAKVRVDTGNLVSDPLYLALDALYERGWSDSEKRKHDPRGTNEWQAVLDLFRVHAARLSQGAQSSGNSGEVAGVSQGDQDEAVAEVIGDDRSTGGRRLIWHSTVALLRTPAGTKLYTPPAERSAVPDGVTDYVHIVPDHCDRFVWRNQYYDLALVDATSKLTAAPQPPEGARVVYVCSNPKCSAVHAKDPCGHCPVCVQSNGVGFSTMRKEVV